jgi:hypothetical protein
MHMTLRTKMFLASAVSGIVIAGTGLAALATAAAAPVITLQIQNGSNVSVTSALVGTPVHASVVVATSSATTTVPTGLVDFNLFAGTSCSGIATTQTGIALDGASAAQSSTTTVPLGGLSYTVHYQGDNNYTAANSGCVSVTATQATPTINLSLSNTSISAGSFVNALSSLSNASSSAGGTVAYKVYSNNTCTTLALDAGSKTVTNASIPNSDPWQFITPGTYWWQVAYSGDTNNTAATSSCNAAGTILTVNATSSPTSTPSIATSLSSSNVLVGSTVYDTATLTNESGNAGGTVTYKVYSNNACTNEVFDAGTKTVTNGSVPNSTPIQFVSVGTYYWRAAYSGDVNNTPATSTCTSEILTVGATTTNPGGPGTISGTVFNDLNKNDKQDGSDTGLSGWTVWLHKANATNTTPWWKNWFKKHDGYNDPIVATATTDSNGNYSFGNLSSGNYFVEEKVMKDWKQTSGDRKVTLTGTTTSADVDFANVLKKANGKDKEKKDKEDKDNHATSTKKSDESKGDNGLHLGWFKFDGTVTGWLHLGKK